MDVRIAVDDKEYEPGKSEAMKYINLLTSPTVDAFSSITTKSSLLTGNTVETGSYNFSPVLSQELENVVLKNMPDVAAQYLEHWQDR